MILDYIPGVPLQLRWSSIKGETVPPALFGIWHLEKSLLSHHFAHSGSLYFADDNHLDELHQKLATKDRIGPTANRAWWRGAYANDADRGPWPDFESMLKSAAGLKLDAISTGVADISPPSTRSVPSVIPHLRRLLELCIRIVPHVSSKDRRSFLTGVGALRLVSPQIPDSRPENVLVEEETKVVQALYERQQRVQDSVGVVAGFLSFSRAGRAGFSGRAEGVDS
ncbi:hypothetical protein K466DRAFT_563024 [Polyporus arcularius HHB13444]|uniref:Uncharacterized protein n=1 Tax=Polyporus arcularius HHB13444 TaxID=1314778 RepID=A0A5C3PYY4_9APHY|nr:hypothetical protein K466DRAFT_563024 [Polyporus arcularius HHB13444]